MFYEDLYVHIGEYLDLCNLIKLKSINENNNNHFKNIKIKCSWKLNTNIINFGCVKIPKNFSINKLNICGDKKIPKLFLLKYFQNVEILNAIGYKLITNRNIRIMQKLKQITVCHCNTNLNNYNNIQITKVYNDCCKKPISHDDDSESDDDSDNGTGRRMNYTHYRPGGLMQLVAYGAQDVYLQSPQVTFFKFKYHRHTNFALDAPPISTTTKKSTNKGYGIHLNAKNNSLKIYNKLNKKNVHYTIKNWKRKY